MLKEKELRKLETQDIKFKEIKEKKKTIVVFHVEKKEVIFNLWESEEKTSLEYNVKNNGADEVLIQKLVEGIKSIIKEKPAYRLYALTNDNFFQEIKGLNDDDFLKLFMASLKSP